MSDQDPDRAWFSPLLNKIAEVAGDRAALILGREKACETIYIPRHVGPTHWLSRLIGHDAASALAGEFGPTKMEIPPALSGQQRKRRAAIAQMTDKGYSINKITRALGVSRSTVLVHRRRMRRDDDDQGSLF
ncbi:helix-turn-helix domain-containing protein [Mesorhizobium sp. ES1-1]|uniref:helix-turn-helix domain-containing protein n=1 Tax=Mesorhizobium sp. ES1-1 TaxID=2876629 RepID=UPI001CCF55F0|nr:helix-turn-helix domain-containing protein [Mesorhizobium sp. ES1-1]MBZ9678917.1 helix-turn-helix domain-containing protein [Mesorhizobium sp. ES1-1]